MFLLLLVSKLFCRIRCLFELHSAKGNLKLLFKKYYLLTKNILSVLHFFLSVVNSYFQIKFFSSK